MAVVDFPPGANPSLLEPASLDGAQALVVEAGWNQVRADWLIFLELGAAFKVAGPGGSVDATAATLPTVGGFGGISMVLVTHARRRQGIATCLLERCIARLRGAGLVSVLDATPAGRLVYQRLGFAAGWPISRWYRAAPSPTPPHTAAPIPGVRAMQRQDLAAVATLDAGAFGCARWRAAVVGHVGHVDAGRDLEQLTGKVQRIAVADRRIVERAGPGPGERDEILHRLHGQFRWHHQHQRRRCQHADTGEIGLGIVGQLAVQQRVDREAGRTPHEKRVTIGRRLRHRVRADDGIAARFVFNHHRLPQRAPHRVGDGACQLVGGAAGRVGNHQLQRLGGKSLRVCRGDGEPCEGTQGAEPARGLR